MERSWLEGYWYGENPTAGARLVGNALKPFSWFYRAGKALARGRGAERLDVPVISVGNLTVGGNGKTPLVIELASRLIRQGNRVAVLSRGYGRTTRGVRVAHVPGGSTSSAKESGDEPILIARRCPEAFVMVGEDRLAAGRLAAQMYQPGVIICDDAFQHRRLHRDLDVVVIHAQRGFGNGRLLPSGPLRERTEAISRANLIVFTHARGESAHTLRRRHWIPENIPAATCTLQPAGFSRGYALADAEVYAETVLAVCAIAHPRSFLDSCREARLKVADSMIFKDHHRFTRRDLERIEQRAEEVGARAVVVTEKDLVRLPPEPFGRPAVALRLALRWDSEEGLAMVELMLADLAIP